MVGVIDRSMEFRRLGGTTNGSSRYVIDSAALIAENVRKVIVASSSDLALALDQPTGTRIFNMKAGATNDCVTDLGIVLFTKDGDIQIVGSGVGVEVRLGCFLVKGN